VRCWLFAAFERRSASAASTHVLPVIDETTQTAIALFHNVRYRNHAQESAQFSAMATELSDPDTVGTALTLQMALGFSLRM